MVSRCSPDVLYVLVLSAAGFGLMLWDKHRARHRQQRIPEAVLMGTALLGGSPGILLGMVLSRHKTRKPMFRIGVPLILMLQWLLLQCPSFPLSIN